MYLSKGTGTNWIQSSNASFLRKIYNHLSVGRDTMFAWIDEKVCSQQKSAAVAKAVILEAEGKEKTVIYHQRVANKIQCQVIFPYCQTCGLLEEKVHYNHL